MKKVKVVIDVYGGVVQAVFGPKDVMLEVVLLDHDNMKAEGKDYATRERIALAACEGLISKY